MNGKNMEVVCSINAMNKALELYEQAIVLSLPNKYYNKETGKCLIPITLDFKLPR